MADDTPKIALPVEHAVPTDANVHQRGYVAPAIKGYVAPPAPVVAVEPASPSAETPAAPAVVEAPAPVVNVVPAPGPAPTGTDES